MATIAAITEQDFNDLLTEPVEVLISAPDWLTITPQNRLDRIADALDVIPDFLDLVLIKGAEGYNEIRKKIEVFAGPAIPEKPIADWFKDWWEELFGEALDWATLPPPEAEA